MREKKSLAIIGVRGIPVVYSGFETFAEELSVRLVKRGYRVEVYARKHALRENRSYKNVKVITLPSINLKGIDTLTHSLISTIHACLSRDRVGIIYYLGVGSSVWSGLPRLFGIKTIVNVDGLDYKREKWGLCGKLFLYWSERWALRLANVTITDSNFVQNYYREKYNANIPVIKYGFSKIKPRKERLDKYNLKPMSYYIWTGRLVPDNHLDELLNAIESMRTRINLVVLGDANKEGNKYLEGLKSKGSRLGVRFLGFVDREDYASLVSYATAYIETKRSGGTHPSLLESMGYGSLIVCNDHDSHVDTLGNTALFYPVGNSDQLGKILERIVLYSNKKKHLSLKERTRNRAREYYGWEGVVGEYEKLFEALLN